MKFKKKMSNIFSDICDIIFLLFLVIPLVIPFAIIVFSYEQISLIPKILKRKRIFSMYNEKYKEEGIYFEYLDEYPREYAGMSAINYCGKIRIKTSSRSYTKSIWFASSSEFRPIMYSLKIKEEDLLEMIKSACISVNVKHQWETILKNYYNDSIDSFHSNFEEDIILDAN